MGPEGYAHFEGGDEFDRDDDLPIFTGGEPTKFRKRLHLRKFSPDHDGHVLGLLPEAKNDASPADTRTDGKTDTTQTDNKTDTTNVDKSLRWLEITNSSSGTDDSGHYVLECCEKANTYIGKVTEPLNLLSIMGPTRSGKSTLMNLLTGCTDQELFNTAPEADSVTKGTDVGSKMMGVEAFSTLDGGAKVTPDDKTQKVAFIDTEGQGDAGDAYDVMLFTPALLCSRIVIFNTTAVGKDTILTSLAMMTLAADQLDFGIKDKADSKSKAKFGALVVIINKYTLGGKDPDETVRKNVLDQEKGTSAGEKRRNGIRDKLLSQFESVSVRTLPGDSLNDGVQDKINDKSKKFLVLSDFKSTYVETFKKLRVLLSNTLKSPRVVAEKKLSGASIAAFVPEIVKSINALEKDGQLHVPNIWDEAENEAITKAGIAFRHNFKDACNKLNQDPMLYSTKVCSDKLDSYIQDSLDIVRKSLSYLSPEKLSNTCSSLQEEANKGKASFLEANLVRIKAFAQTELISLTSSLDTTLNKGFPNKLVSAKFMKTKLDQLQHDLFRAYKNKVEAYDEKALPADSSVIYDDAFETARETTRQTISTAWNRWIVDIDKESLDKFVAAMGELRKSIKLGDDAHWKQAVDEKQSSFISTYNDTITLKYLWEEKKSVLDTHKQKMKEARDLADASFKADESTILSKIQAELEKQLRHYQAHLDDALPANQDPGDFKTITDVKEYRDAFVTFLKQQDINESLRKDYLDSFDDKVSSKKSEFKKLYTADVDHFLAYLEKELVNIAAERLAKCKIDVDSIDISATLLLSNLSSKIDGYKTSQLTEFDAAVKVFNATQDNSKRRVSKVRDKLKEDLEDHKRATLLLLVTLIDQTNRETLNRYANPVLTGVVDYTITSTPQLNTAIEKARTAYYGAACGDTEDQNRTWATFSSKTQRLYNNIRRTQNMYIVQGISSSSSTSDMEKKVMDKIKASIASLANGLGMSWICYGTEFVLETKPDGKARYHLQKNMSEANGYDSNHRTSLRFHHWKAEFSDFVFDDPTVREMEPFMIKTLTVPNQKDDYVVPVSVSQTESSTISNSNTVMFTIDSEYSASVGVEGVASSSVKTALQIQTSFENRKENQIAFNVEFSVPVACPANRTTTINCLGFKQLMAVTYTAKMKLIPQVTFTGGFTRWGGDDDSNRNYLKGHKRERIYSDIPNGYTNEFKEKAAADSDPWEWQTCIKDHSYVQDLVNRISKSENYEMYVRGKWEGVTGWKHVIQTDIKVK